MNRKYRDTLINSNWKMNQSPTENKEFKTWQKHLVFRDAHGNELTYAQYKAGPRISGKKK